MKEKTHEEPKIVAAAEKKMRAWSIIQEIAEQTGDLERRERYRHGLGEYITISREAGASGSLIARIVGQTLGWEVLDKNILEQLADRYHISRAMLDLVDETTYNWVHDIIGPWFDHRIVPHEKYLVYMTRLFLAAAKRGNVVFVGRGAQFLLPRDCGMAVRIVASEHYRIARIMEEFKLSEAAAKRFMHEVDRGRREFVLKYFHRDLNDPHQFDLVVHVDRLGPQGAADEIVTTYKQSFATRKNPQLAPEFVGGSNL
jgi:cytidylate kinase